jgi:hypothetical protein
MFQPVRHFLGLSTLLVLVMLLLPHLSSAQGVTSNDPNFTPSLLKSNLSVPSGLVFRSPTGDLLVSQFGLSQVSLVSFGDGVNVSPFASQTSADEVAVRSSDGLVAVKTEPNGPIVFYNSTGGTSIGSIPGSAIPVPGAPTPSNVCITGLAFNASGNLFVAAGPGTPVQGGCQTTNWAIYEFLGPTPWTATQPTSPVASFNQGDLIEGLAFSAAPLPAGSLYAVSTTTGNVYQLSCLDCIGGVSVTTIATVPTTSTDGTIPGISGIAIDPLLGDIYISEFNGTDVLRIPPGGIPPNSEGSPFTFATGFSNAFGLAFDTNGNLYVNETNAGNLWEFTRNSFATSQQPIVKGQTLTFANPFEGMSDQTQAVLIPTSANLNGAAFLQDIFVQVSPATLDARLAQGSAGDITRFGGRSVPAGTLCVPIPSAGNNCLVTIQKCYDANGQPFDICPVQEPSSGPGSSDLIQLASSYSAPSAPPNSAFLIDFDTPPNHNTLTDITTNPFDCCTGSGGTKSLCSATIIADEPPIITITTPAGGAVYSLGGAVAANFACTDPQPQPAGFPTCNGSVANGSNINTATLGTKTFTVSSTDSLGASANQSVTYTVVQFNAFVQQPINPDGSSIFNAKRGVIPVKFTLTQNNVATCAIPAAMIALTRTAGGTVEAIDESTYVMSADSGPNFRISGCQYVYNLAASSLGAGTYRVDIIISGAVVGSGVFALK